MCVSLMGCHCIGGYLQYPVMVVLKAHSKTFTPCSFRVGHLCYLVHPPQTKSWSSGQMSSSPVAHASHHTVLRACRQDMSLHPKQPAKSVSGHIHLLF